VYILLLLIVYTDNGISSEKINPYISYFGSLCNNLIILACFYTQGMSNNRQQHARVILLVAFASIMAISMIAAATVTEDVMAGKNKPKKPVNKGERGQNGQPGNGQDGNSVNQNGENGDPGSNCNSQNSCSGGNGDNGGDSKRKTGTGGNGENGNGQDGTDGGDASGNTNNGY
jgi:hypothetical protein